MNEYQIFLLNSTLSEYVEAIVNDAPTPEIALIILELVSDKKPSITDKKLIKEIGLASDFKFLRKVYWHDNPGAQINLHVDDHPVTDPGQVKLAIRDYLTSVGFKLIRERKEKEKNKPEVELKAVTQQLIEAQEEIEKVKKYSEEIIKETEEKTKEIASLKQELTATKIQLDKLDSSFSTKLARLRKQLYTGPFWLAATSVMAIIAIGAQRYSVVGANNSNLVTDNTALPNNPPVSNQILLQQSPIFKFIPATTIKPHIPQIIEPKPKQQAANINNAYSLHYFVRAAINGNIDEIEECLAAGIDVNGKDQGIITALYAAAGQGHKDIVERLLKAKGIDVNIEVQDSTALSVAVKTGHKNVVETLLNDIRTDVNAKDKDGNFALFFAAREGHKVVVKMLLNDKRTDVNAKNNFGGTALVIAAAKLNFPIFKLLASAGADFNSKYQGLTAQQYTKNLYAKSSLTGMASKDIEQSYIKIINYKPPQLFTEQQQNQKKASHNQRDR